MENTLVVELYRILPTLISCCCLTFATVSKSTAGSGFCTRYQGHIVTITQHLNQKTKQHEDQKTKGFVWFLKANWAIKG